LVPQQPKLLADSIAANISYGLHSSSPLNTLDNIRGAAQAAGIDEFISSLPNGYETVLGDGGICLSGGQAQRVAIARSLIRQPQILILDEVTASLDGESADIIKCTIRRLVAAERGLAVIIITHAREMMEIAENVIVMDHGSVVEEGPYHVLLQKPGGKLRHMLTADDTDNLC
jgi:ATP-binding cassette subfamily B (MDR/TAP) protein 1